MHRIIVLSYLVVTGCSFSSEALPAGDPDGSSPPADAPPSVDGATGKPDGAVDAPRGPDAAAGADAPLEMPDSPVSVPDAPPPDGPADVPDAIPDPCPTASKPLPLATSLLGSLGGSSASTYTPTCMLPGTTGAEDFYRSDLGDAPDTDLVFDVEEGGGLDSVLDVTSSCAGFGGAGRCANVGGPGAGEVVVVPSAMSGHRYVAVDSVMGTSGNYTITAFVRAIIARRTACDPLLLSSRCTLGFTCVDRNNDGNAICDDLPSMVSSHTGDLDSACKDFITASDDLAVLGTITSKDDVDVVRLRPSRPTKLRVVVDDGQGGCPVDAVLEVVTSDSCTGAFTVSDDNSGLGPCPLLENVALDPNQTYWLRIHLATGAPLPFPAMYSMVIDFHP